MDLVTRGNARETRVSMSVYISYVYVYTSVHVFET